MNNKNKQKGISLAHVCFESHILDVSVNSWWIDIVVSIHMLQIFYGNLQWRGDQDEIDLFVGSGEIVKVEWNTVELKLKSGFV